MLAQALALGHDDDPLGVNPQADVTVRKRSRHPVAVALEVHQAGRGHALGLFDKAVKGSPQGHQALDLTCMRIGHAARKVFMHDLAPLGYAQLFKARRSSIEVCEEGRRYTFEANNPPEIYHVHNTAWHKPRITGHNQGRIPDFPPCATTARLEVEIRWALVSRPTKEAS